MLTKVKRVKRKKYAVGDEARKFEKIPTASQPQQQKMGTRDQFVDKYVTGQIKTPELADSAKQTYTTQAVQQPELLTGATQVAPTDVSTKTITGQTIATPTALTAAQAATPTGPTTSTMTAGTGTAQTGTAQAGTVGTSSQIGTVTGTLSGTATGATGSPTSSAVAQAASGNLSGGALAQVLSGTAATVAGQTATLPGAITQAVANNPATVTATVMNQPTAVQAQIAALPTDTLVSAQIETLLNGIDTGTIPTWARGAVDNVEKNLAQRGLSKSTIGRDALVNAIIQSAFQLHNQMQLPYNKELHNN